MENEIHLEKQNSSGLVYIVEEKNKKWKRQQVLTIKYTGKLKKKQRRENLQFKQKEKNT